MAKIALFGANGTIGSRVLREALDRGHQVTAVVRDPKKLTETHENLTVVTGDVLDPKSVEAVAAGQDVVVSAVGGGDGPGHVATIEPAAKSLVAGVRALGEKAPRLITVGGAGSLRTPDGKQVWDAEGLPEFLLQIMHAHGDALDYYRTVTDVRWTNLSPAGLIEPGERTGTYRTALEDLVVDGSGKSRISAEDYAVALVDEIEEANHIGERFTVGD
ncbi:NAD(P)H-binding protein [Streptomyces sp. NRRL B-1677]|uniref:NAD-dependent epimerase/dehydratase family protein n=1 Tax=Streptomyces klenkii TaxID=1420899 RepID=A0A3B0BKA2_9ACTN|nr:MULTISPECIES: NAD(P)H-binding protein [Streptomyces]MBF6047788.1 NAD(P)H-binding protein [Streptomyces sp. NRRL B-1677]RKN74275.1 NAD-dependent epimerase/dehydratase family protein [Streptomyces klenkii]